MGLIHAEIRLINGDDLTLARKGFIKTEDVRELRTEALVDSGAYMLVINETIKNQLKLDVLELRLAQLADGSLRELEVVGPIEVRFENRRSLTQAMVAPGDAEVLLGAIPMEDMDVLIDPQRQRLMVNPQHPLQAQMSLKGLPKAFRINEL